VAFAVAVVLVKAVLICGCVHVQTSTNTGSGNGTSEMKGATPFSAIDFAIPGTTRFPDNTSSVKVEAESNVVANARKAVNGALKISAASLGFQTMRPVNVYVSTPSVTSITNSGVGTILNSTLLDTNTLNLKLQGAEVLTSQSM